MIFSSRFSCRIDRWSEQLHDLWSTWKILRSHTHQLHYSSRKNSLPDINACKKSLRNNSSLLNSMLNCLLSWVLYVWETIFFRIPKRFRCLYSSISEALTSFSKSNNNRTNPCLLWTIVRFVQFMMFLNNNYTDFVDLLASPWYLSTRS